MHKSIISNIHIALKPTWFGVMCSTPVGSLNLPDGIPTAWLVPWSFSHLHQASDGLSHKSQVPGISCSEKPPRFRPTSGFLLLAFQQGTGMTAASWVFSHHGCFTLCAAGSAGITTFLEVRVTQWAGDRKDWDGKSRNKHRDEWRERCCRARLQEMDRELRKGRKVATEKQGGTAPWCGRAGRRISGAPRPTRAEPIPAPSQSLSGGAPGRAGRTRARSPGAGMGREGAGTRTWQLCPPRESRRRRPPGLAGACALLFLPPLPSSAGWVSALLLLPWGGGKS